MILNGYAIAEKRREQLKEKIEELKMMHIIPKLAVIQIGKNEASNIYIRNKRTSCEKVGIEFELFSYEETITMKELKEEIQALNKDKKIHGILVQSPLPNHLNEAQVFNEIEACKDVDGFTSQNIACLWNNQSGLTSCTPKGIINLLKEYNIEISGKHVVILGRSNIVGKPLALLFLKENASVTILHSKSKNIREMTTHADILVSAVGKPNTVTEDMIKVGAIVIDVGINRVDGYIKGDVDFDNVSKKASYLTPVPKGIGPMTVESLLENVVEAIELQRQKKDNFFRK